MFKYFVYKFGKFCVNRLPLKLSYRIAIFISDLHYLLSFRDRKAVKNNLEAIGIEKQRIPSMTREVFRNFGKYLVEFFRMVNEINSEFIKEKVMVENLNRIKEVLDRGKGVILLTAHLGNWEMGGAIVSLLGYPSIAIALPHKERPVNNLFNEQRQKRGVQVVSTQIAIRKCFESLKNNQIVAVLGDRDFSANGHILNFFGRKTLIPIGPAMFAYRTGAGIIPSVLVREGSDKFRLIIEDPIYPPAKTNDEEGEEAAIVKIMRKYMLVLEEKIRMYPDQWLMFRKFWVD